MDWHKTVRYVEYHGKRQREGFIYCLFIQAMKHVTLTNCGTSAAMKIPRTTLKIRQHYLLSCSRGRQVKISRGYNV